MKIKIMIFLAVFCFCAANAFAQGGVKAEPKKIQFAKGKTSTSVSGTLSNNEEMDYVFGAKAGQKITLKVTSLPKGDFFEFTLMGEDFDLETEYDSYSDYSFTAPQAGSYLVSVRKRPTGKTPKAKFFLTLTIK